VEAPEGPERAYLGFIIVTETSLTDEYAGQEFFLSILIFIISTLQVVFLFNLNVAIINLLPVLPFDGFKMFEELLKSFNVRPERRKKIANYIVGLIVILLLLNALPLGGLVAGVLTG